MQGLFLVLLISPFWISYLMRIYAWQSLLQPDGYVNEILIGLHIVGDPVNWLAGKPITVILGLVYGYIPFMILPLFGSLDRIDQSLLEAGRDLGASPLRDVPAGDAAAVEARRSWRGSSSCPCRCSATTTRTTCSARPQTSMFGNLIDNAVTQAGRRPEAGSLVIILMVLVIVPMLYYLHATKRAAGAAMSERSAPPPAPRPTPPPSVGAGSGTRGASPTSWRASRWSTSCGRWCRW